MDGLRLILVLAAFATQAGPAVVLAQSTEGEHSPPLETYSSMDVLQADARIRQIMEGKEAGRYHEAGLIYLALLARLDAPASAAETDVLLEHLRSTALVLPAAMRARIKSDEAVRQRTLTSLTRDAGDQLVHWWRRQDPLPATESNERLEEHLVRVAYAAQTFADPDDPRQWDDRGEIYVRLGPPEQREIIEVSPGMLAFDYRNTAPAPRLPDNEVWTYRHVDDGAVYVFVRNSANHPYRLGVASDLISTELRSGILRGSSGPAKARLLVGVMEDVYAQLALLHPSFGPIYDEVAAFQALPPNTAGSPVPFIQRAVLIAQAEDDVQTWRRDRIVAASYYRGYEPVETIDLPIRWARFLEPDGTTRTEVYWSVPMHEMRPSRRLVRQLERQHHVPSDDYLLTTTLVRLAPDFTRRAQQIRHFLVPAQSEGVLESRTLSVLGDTGRYHLALQWEQRWTETSADGTMQPGARLKIGTARFDSLDALNADERRLELSDLKPLVRMSDEALHPYTPYPFEALPPEPSVTLYFEVYHLAFGADDRTRYTIECEVSRQAERSLIPFLSRSAESASVRTVSSSAERTARERIELDLSAWDGDLEITVRVRDDITGEERTRTIAFSSSREAAGG